MGKRVLFPSVKAPNIRYAVYESFIDNPTNSKGFSDRVTAFDTYGDGDVQHCHEWSVQPDELCDFLESLMMYLGSHDEDEWFHVMDHLWPNSLDEKHAREVIAFASKPLYKDDKHSWNRTFNLRECKVSTSDAKKHDRRWEKVESWHDGSFSAFITLTNEYRPYGLLGLWSWCRFVYDNSDYGEYDFRKLYGWEPEPYRRCRDAFEVCEDYIRSVERVRRCRQWVASRCENLQLRLTKQAELANAQD